MDVALTLLPQVNVVADVGCDHGYFGQRALKCGLAQQVVFSDISKKSLSKSESNNSGRNAEFVVCDGIPKNYRLDAVAILGMGGKNIIKILHNSELKYEYLLLQPLTNIIELREYLNNIDYELRIDKVVLISDKFYHFILCKRSKITDLNEMELLFGRTNIKEKDEDFYTFLDYSESNIKNAIAKIDKNVLCFNEVDYNKKKNILNLIDKLRGVRNDV